MFAFYITWQNLNYSIFFRTEISVRTHGSLGRAVESAYQGVATGTSGEWGAWTLAGHRNGKRVSRMTGGQNYGGGELRIRRVSMPKTMHAVKR